MATTTTTTSPESAQPMMAPPMSIGSPAMVMNGMATMSLNNNNTNPGTPPQVPDPHVILQALQQLMMQQLLAAGFRQSPYGLMAPPIPQPAVKKRGPYNTKKRRLAAEQQQQQQQPQPQKPLPPIPTINIHDDNSMDTTPSQPVAPASPPPQRRTDEMYAESLARVEAVGLGHNVIQQPHLARQAQVKAMASDIHPAFPALPVSMPQPQSVLTLSVPSPRPLRARETTIMDESKLPLPPGATPSMRQWYQREMKQLSEQDDDSAMVSAQMLIKAMCDVLACVSNTYEWIECTAEIEDKLQHNWITREFGFLRSTKANVLVLVQRPNTPDVGSHKDILRTLADKFPVIGFIYVNASDEFRPLKCNDRTRVKPDLDFIGKHMDIAVQRLSLRENNNNLQDCMVVTDHTCRLREIRVAYICASMREECIPYFFMSDAESVTQNHFSFEIVYRAG
jgi:hypothetical protein